MQKKKGVWLCKTTEESDDCSGVTEAVNEPVSSIATSTDVRGEDIDALVKKCELLRIKLSESESKLKNAQLRISFMEYDDKMIDFTLDLLHTNYLRCVLTSLDQLWKI